MIRKNDPDFGACSLEFERCLTRQDHIKKRESFIDGSHVGIAISKASVEFSLLN